VEGVLAPLLLFLLVLLLLFFHYPKPLLFFGLIVCLSVGWLSLKHWTVPLALPALLIGFFGLDEHPFSRDPASHESWGVLVRDALVGVAAGLLPGFGPGLISLFWFSVRPSVSLAVSNLVFSLGFVAISGKVRSAPAAFLVMDALPSWAIILCWLGVSFILVLCLFRLFPNALFRVDTIWISFFYAGMFLLLGGWLSLGTMLLAFCVSQMLRQMHLPPSLGLVMLIPSLVWFYA
jgi:hypothetical protein